MVGLGLTLSIESHWLVFPASADSITKWRLVKNWDMRKFDYRPAGASLPCWVVPRARCDLLRLESTSGEVDVKYSDCCEVIKLSWMLWNYSSLVEFISRAFHSGLAQVFGFGRVYIKGLAPFRSWYYEKIFIQCYFTSNCNLFYSSLYRTWQMGTTYCSTLHISHICA